MTKPKRPTNYGTCGYYPRLLLLVPLALASCLGARNQGVLRITPSTLFAGDLGRLEPHVCVSSGSVRLRYAGAKKPLRVALVLWQEGKPEGLGEMELTLEGVVVGEINITLNDVRHENGGVIYGVVCSAALDGRCVTIRLHVPKYEREGTSGRDLVLRGRGLDVWPNREVSVWGYALQRPAMLAREGSIEELAKASECAVTVTVRTGEDASATEGLEPAR